MRHASQPHLLAPLALLVTPSRPDTHRSSRMERMATLEPLFVDVTWGAGGSTSDLTLAISANAQKYLGVEVLMHLTCTNLKVRSRRGLPSAGVRGCSRMVGRLAIMMFGYFVADDFFVD